MSGAGKPKQTLIIPDILLSGRSDVVHFPIEKGSVPGVCVADSDNLGRAFPLQAGNIDSGEANFDYLITRAGGVFSGEYVQKQSTEFEWYGTHDPRRFYGYQTPDPSGPGSDNCSQCYLPEYRNLVLGKVSQSTNLFERFIKIKSEYSGIYDPWVVAPPTALANPVAPDHHSLAMETLADGRMIAIVRTQDSSGRIDFDVYHSVDGGFTVTLVSEGIIEHFTTDNTFGTHNLDNQIRVAVSGEHVCLCFANGGGALNTWLSRDRGITWQRVTTSPGAGDFQLGASGDPDDPYPFDLCSVNDAGTFLLCHIESGGATSVSRNRTRTSDGLWGPAITVSAVSHPSGLKAITLVRTPDYIWQVTFYSDSSTATANDFYLRRANVRNWENWVSIFPAFPGWEQSEAPFNLVTVEHYPTRMSGVWVGDGISFYSGMKDYSTNQDKNWAVWWTSGGWDTRSVGLYGPATRLDQMGSAGLYIASWNTMSGDFGLFPLGYWEQSGAGAASVAVNLDRARFESPGGALDWKIGNTKGAPNPFTNPDEWGSGGNGMMWGFVCKVDPGSGNVLPAALVSADDGIGARLTSYTSAGGGGAYISTIRLNDTTLQHVCHGPAPTEHTIFGMDNTGWIEVRVSQQQNPATLQLEEQVAVYNHNFKFWTVGTAIVRSLQPAIGGPGLGFGIIQPVTTGLAQGIEFREAWIIEGIPDDIRIVDAANPDDLFGMPLSPSQMELDRGMLVSWGGAGAALGDTFVGEVEHIYGIERVFNSCPRIQFRSDMLRMSGGDVIVSGSRFNNSDWDLTPSTGIMANFPFALTGPYGVPANADRLRYFNLLPAASATVMTNTWAYSTPFAGYTLKFWAQSAQPMEVEISLAGGAPIIVALDVGWQFHEFVIVAGAGAPGFEVKVLNYPGGIFWEWSFFEIRCVLQTYTIFDSHKGEQNDNRYNHTAASVFGTNCRRWIVDYSDVPDFSVATAPYVLDSVLYDTDNVPLTVVSCTENQIQFSPNTRVVRGSLVGKYIRMTSGTATSKDSWSTWKVIEHGDNNTLLVDSEYTPSVASLELVGVVGGDTFICFDDRAAFLYPEERQYRFVRLRAWDLQPAEQEVRLGVLQLGRKLHIDVPLDWAFTDNQQPNVTTYRSKGAVTWAYNEGPSQRKIVARLVGDVERYRDKLKYVQEYLQFETRPMTLILDEDAIGEEGNGPQDKVVLARLTSGNQQDNAAWYFDSDGVLRTAGDLSMTFEEEV